MKETAIFYDTFLCTACKGCQVACKCWNDLPSSLELNSHKFSGSYQNPPDLGSETRLIMTFNEKEGGSKGVEWAFGRRSCQHCTNAACVDICPAGALYRDPETGMVTTDESKCIGCQYCSSACPFDVPRYHGPKGTINKCTGCVDRIANGMAPACVTSCQAGALQFGTRQEMMALAEKRLRDLKLRGFDKACIYGSEEMGGLHVIQVLKYGKEAHGMPENPQANPLSGAVSLMKPVTAVATGVTVAGLAAMFLMGTGYKRDEKVYNEYTEDTIIVETGEVVKHGDGPSDMTVAEHLCENMPFGPKKGGKDE